MSLSSEGRTNGWCEIFVVLSVFVEEIESKRVSLSVRDRLEERGMEFVSIRTVRESRKRTWPERA